MRGDGSGIGNRGLLIASVIFILIVGAFFFWLTGNFFGGNETPDNRAKVTDIFSGRSVRMTVEGPVVANEDHESYRIQVGTDQRTIEVFKGYDMKPLATNKYPNNLQAYTDFVYALERLNYGVPRNVSGLPADSRGACASGKRYTFEILDNGRSLSSLWTSSCSNVKGTLNANGSQIKQLFDKQISNRNTVLKPISLR